jgi:hypothetical protein
MRRVSECEICSTCFDGPTKATAFCQIHWSCAIVPLQIPAFQEMSSREMKLWSTVMILRPGFRVLNGNHPVLLVRKKARQSSSNIKVMMIVFFDFNGIVRAEFVPRKTRVNSEYCNGLLERLRKDMRRKLPEKWGNGFILHHETLWFTHRFWYGNFCQIKLLRCVLIHLIHRISHRATSGSSPKSK